MYMQHLNRKVNDNDDDDKYSPMSVIISRRALQTTNGRFIEHRRGESEQKANEIQPAGPSAVADDSSRRKYATTRRCWSKTTRSTWHTDNGNSLLAGAAVLDRGRSVEHTQHSLNCPFCCRCTADNYVRRYVTASVPPPAAAAQLPAVPVLVSMTFSFAPREHRWNTSFFTVVAIQVAIILSLKMPKATRHCNCISSNTPWLANSCLMYK